MQTRVARPVCRSPRPSTACPVTLAAMPDSTSPLVRKRAKLCVVAALRLSILCPPTRTSIDTHIRLAPTDTYSSLQCPAGTFSVGGGKRVESFSEWPTEWDVETYCTADGSATPMVHCGWYSTVRSSSSHFMYPSFFSLLVSDWKGLTCCSHRTTTIRSCRAT